MKFVHMADMHFDAPFVNLADNNDFGKLRRLEQRNIFRKIIDYIKENEIPYFFVAGDLYEHNCIRQSTIEYINDLFKTIPNTKIFITPGNHDPFLKNSFYNSFMWNENVTIFDENISKIEFDDVNIYGFGFSDFYSARANLEEIKIENDGKLNILVIHGTLDGSDMVEKVYNPISKNLLENIGFDYVALGHIHKRGVFGKSENIVYPGSCVSLGFDEQGEHGVIAGDIEKDKLKLEFISLEANKFEEKDVDISLLKSEEDLIEMLNNLDLNENTFYKLNLTGIRHFELNINEIKKLIQLNNVLKVKNKTKIDIDLEEISKRTTLSGMYAKEIVKALEKGEYSKEYLDDILEIGLQILDK